MLKRPEKSTADSIISKDSETDSTQELFNSFISSEIYKKLKEAYGDFVFTNPDDIPELVRSAPAPIENDTVQKIKMIMENGRGCRVRRSSGQVQDGLLVSFSPTARSLGIAFRDVNDGRIKYKEAVRLKEFLEVN